MTSLQIRRYSLLSSGTMLLACALLSSSYAQSAAKGWSIALDLRDAKLAFSSDGRVLHLIGESQGSSQLQRIQHVRAITYDTTTGSVLHTINLPPDTRVLSTSFDGRTAIVAQRTGDHIELSVIDTETGKAEPIPHSWYDLKDDEPVVSLSGDGRLISFYSEAGPDDRPTTVTVYTWPAMTLLARQTSEFTNAGGIVGGGITVDGKDIEFDNNRSGRELIDLTTSRKLWFRWASLRSPDGRWTVELPDQSFDESPESRKILIEDGRNGQKLATIDRKVNDTEAYGRMTGAFCGTTGIFILAGEDAVGAYSIPSGHLLQAFSMSTWRSATSADSTFPYVACSPNAKQVAIVSGNRFTLHALK
jgi:hypothetical protein